MIQTEEATSWTSGGRVMPVSVVPDSPWPYGWAAAYRSNTSAVLADARAATSLTSGGRETLRSEVAESSWPNGCAAA